MECIQSHLSGRLPDTVGCNTAYHLTRINDRCIESFFDLFYKFIKTIAIHLLHYEDIFGTQVTS